MPTATNLQTVYLAQQELLRFVGVQQSVATHLDMQVPLLAGMFVLVPSAQLQQQLPPDLQAALPGSGDSSAVAAAIPWRLRQVAAVEVAPGVDPADATVVLVGGDRVRAGAVGCPALGDVPEHEVGLCGCQGPLVCVHTVNTVVSYNWCPTLLQLESWRRPGCGTAGPFICGTEPVSVCCFQLTTWAC